MNKDYLAFFDFRDDPFKLTPDINYYYFSKNHEFIFEHLIFFFESDESFAVIVGEPGTGKTITVRKFIDEIKDKAEVAYILFPSLKPIELFIAILEDLKIKIPTGITKNKLFSLFRDYLVKKREEGKKVIVIIDEAQNLPIETLEELRILSNLETDDEKLIKILLVGQPELLDKLERPELRQLKQRITIIQEVKPLSQDEIKKYVLYRITKADGKVDINDDVFKLLYKITNGYPRLINQVMDRALMAAYLDKSKVIKKEHVEKAAESLKLITERDELKIKSYINYILVLGVLIFITIGSFYIFYDYLLNKKQKRTIQANIDNFNTVNLEKEETKQPEQKVKGETKIGKYILYLYTTVNLKDAFKKKDELEKLINKKLYVLRVKNGKYYAVALLYDDKQKALEDLPKLKMVTGYNDAFVTPKKYIPEIIESLNSSNSKAK